MKIGIIGCGNMGRAILGGLIKSGAASSQEVVVSDASEANRLDAEEKFGVRTFSENAACAKEADLVVFAVKPGVLPLAAADVRDVLREELAAQRFFMRSKVTLIIRSQPEGKLLCQALYRCLEQLWVLDLIIGQLDHFDIHALERLAAHRILGTPLLKLMHLSVALEVNLCVFPIQVWD